MTSTKNPNKKLNKKEEKFCQIYVNGSSLVNAYIEAGYSYSDRYHARQEAYKMKQKPYILRRIQELEKQAEDECIMKRREILIKLSDMARGNTTEENIVADKNGNYKIVETKAKCKEQVKALELLGKHYAMLTDKQEVTGNINTNVTFVDDLEDE